MPARDFHQRAGARRRRRMHRSGSSLGKSGSPPRRTRGFTLLEVMIAAGILAAMGGIVFGMFQHAWRQKEDVEYADNRYAQIRAAMDRMALEISEAYLSEHFDHNRYRERPTFFHGKGGSSGELSFTSLANERFEADSKTGDQGAITYYLDRDPELAGQQDLFRKVNPIIDEDAEQHGRKQVICEDVKGLKFEFWDTIRSDWDDDWDASHTEHMGVLPERVRITLTYADEDGKDRKFTTQVRIPLQRSLAF